MRPVHGRGPSCHRRLHDRPCCRLVSRLDRAAYLGRELARAEHAMLTGGPYRQDAAPARVS